MNKSTIAVVSALIGAAVLTYGLWPETNAGKRSTTKTQDFDVTKFEPEVVIARSFSAIVNPDSFTIAKVGSAVRPKELVLGVEVDGTARAYPINMLTGPNREIINDELGDKAIAATW